MVVTHCDPYSPLERSGSSVIMRKDRTKYRDLYDLLTGDRVASLGNGERKVKDEYEVGTNSMVKSP